MKKRVITFILPIIFCSFLSAQQLQPSNEVLMKLSKRAKLSAEKTEAIQTLLNQKEQDYKKKREYESLVDSESIVYIPNNKISDAEIERKFNLGLSQILTKKEFALFFRPIIDALVKYSVDEKIELASKTFSLSKSQKAKLSESITPYCNQEVFQHLYYKYDNQLHWRFTEKAKLETNEVYFKTLQEMGYNPIDAYVPEGERENDFARDAISAGLSNQTVKEILRLVAWQDKKIKDYESHWGKMHATSVIGYYDNKANKNAIYNEFKRELAKLITIDQYKTLFKKHLQERIDKYANQTLNHMKLAYSLSKPQIKSLEGIVYKNTLDEIAIEEYYAFNYQTLDAERKKQQIKTIRSYQNYLGIVDKTYIGSIDNYEINIAFVNRMHQSGVPEKSIKNILEALTQRDIERMQSGINWASDAQNQIMHFYFEDEDEEGIKKRFRATLRLYLTEKQFSEIFNEVLQPRVEQQVKSELSLINSRYVLTEKQLTEIEELLEKRFQKEVLYRQYYDHKYDTRDQKINGAKYAFIKAFKNKMKTFGF